MNVQLALRGSPLSIPIYFEPSDRPSTFAFSLHKAGSVLLNNVLTDLSHAASIPVVDLPGQAFMAGHRDDCLAEQDVSALLRSPGYTFVGFRALWPYVPADALQGRRKVVLVRDPRDILVSLYYSHAMSHVIPSSGETKSIFLSFRENAQSLGIDAYAMKSAGFIFNNFRSYFRLIDDPDCRIYRYEDVIFRKNEWVRDIANHLRFDVPDDVAAAIARKHDILPEKEDAAAHVRQVTPGNFRKRLRSSTVRQIETMFSDVMRTFGYRPEPRFFRLGRCPPRNSGPVHFPKPPRP